MRFPVNDCNPSSDKMLTGAEVRLLLPAVSGSLSSEFITHSQCQTASQVIRKPLQIQRVLPI